MTSTVTVKDSLGRYIDAGFPIIYIYTFEEEKTDKLISSIAGRKKVLEWNGANGFCDFAANATLSNYSLEATLLLLKRGNDLDRSILVIKDAAELLKSDKIVALLKEIARKIRNG